MSSSYKYITYCNHLPSSEIASLWYLACNATQSTISSLYWRYMSRSRVFDCISSAGIICRCLRLHPVDARHIIRYNTLCRSILAIYSSHRTLIYISSTVIRCPLLRLEYSDTWDAMPPKLIYTSLTLPPWCRSWNVVAFFPAFTDGWSALNVDLACQWLALAAISNKGSALSDECPQKVSTTRFNPVETSYDYQYPILLSPHLFPNSNHFRRVQPRTNHAKFAQQA